MRPSCLPTEFDTIQSCNEGAIRYDVLHLCSMNSFRTSTVAILCSLSLTAWAPLYAQQPQTPSTAANRQVVQDPAEIYLTAYRLCRESERLAQQQNYNAAISRGQQAEKILAGIVKDYPHWKNNLVSMRRRLLAENMAAYRQKAKDAPIPTGRQPGRPISMEGPRTTLVPQPVNPPKDGDAAPSQYQPIELPDYDSTDKKLYNALALAQEECRRMAAAYKEINTKFEDVQKQLIVAQTEQKMYKERYENLQEQITSERAAGNQVVDSLSRQLAEMEAKYRASEDARQKAESRVAELETTLAATQAELERVTRERDALKAENEQLRAIVELNSPEKTKALLDQNLTLDQQLKDAQARVSELEAQMAGSGDQQAVMQQQLDEARAEADRLRDEMSGIYEENMGYRRRVSDLTERLNNLEADLETQANVPSVDPALAEENKLLREVIAKQKRTIAMQEEGRKLLIETYKQIKNQDPATLSALQKLDQESSLDLTDAERRVMEAVKNSVAGTEQGEKEAAAAVREGLEAEALANLAAKAFSKGRYTAAEQLYRTLYDSNPDHVAGLVNLGTILLYRNKCEEGIEYLTRAARLAPDLAISYYLAGICHYRLDRMDQARIMFARTIELDPGNAEAFFYLANIEAINGEYEAALKHFAAAVKLKSGLGDAHYNMARLYAEMKKIPDAARAYDRSIANGAEPDPEFEQYLRNHPDNTNQPGEDLVETVNPQDEANELRKNDPEMDDIIARRDAERLDDPVAPMDPDAEPGETTDQPAEGETTAPVAPEDPFDIAVREIRRDIETVKTPSSAGKGHEVDPNRFRTIRIRSKMRDKRGRRIRAKLRLKRPEPQRLRRRGSEEIREIKTKR